MYPPELVGLPDAQEAVPRAGGNGGGKGIVRRCTRLTSPMAGYPVRFRLPPPLPPMRFPNPFGLRRSARQCRWFQKLASRCRSARCSALPNMAAYLVRFRLRQQQNAAVCESAARPRRHQGTQKGAWRRRSRQSVKTLLRVALRARREGTGTNSTTPMPKRRLAAREGSCRRQSRRSALLLFRQRPSGDETAPWRECSTCEFQPPAR
jgi:hypothetical protein